MGELKQRKIGLGQDAIAAISSYRQQAASLLLYQAVLADRIGQAFLQLLAALTQGSAADILSAYGDWFQALAAGQQSWQQHLVNRILQAENPLTSQLTNPNQALVEAARHDLQILQTLYSCEPQQVAQWVEMGGARSHLPAWTVPTADLPVTFPDLPDWREGLDELMDYYRAQGTGLLAQFKALRWQQGELIGIPHADPIRLDQLAGYDRPKQQLIQNTRFLLAGYAALHMLLYGSRGSGKSSLVKALLNEYGSQGLRLIEVAPEQMRDLPLIVERLRAAPQKFIIFVDDLSFESDDEAFKALKRVLEGSVTARPQNVVVYATSNRRHLVREFFDERPSPGQAEELQAWDTLQEKLSFSDRFGLTLTFEPADQPTYLTIVRHLAKQAGIRLEPTDLDHRARQWATRHNGRSGRSARQFVDFLQAELALQWEASSSVVP
ncbi:ATP-binding protein [Romeria aff. gracilis LEGE 07310]|uniref:ATP-binding protein n=1 Tax=Vasconcelosia minhoensis LEGE 07310 TaxID=915328 RepID=A0A8J7A7A4_9CYAN|nr:ATP-binding protein [Romeria gracilis]MBE9078212.1 ATP-binding protein [Romeria aff. gracilis LEGE 07310]